MKLFTTERIEKMPGLSGEQLVGFQRDGFLLLPGLLSDPLLDELSQEYDELFRCVLCIVILCDGVL